MGATLVPAPIQAPEVNWSDPRDFDRKWADYTDTLATLARQQYEGDLVGELVRWQRADGYATYMVLSEKPLRLVHIDMLDGYMVENALLNGLTLAEVRRMVEWERNWKRASTEPNERFYGSVKVGDIVHYEQSTAAFVRCQVVKADVMEPNGRDTIGGVALKVIALVGEIGKRRLPDGTWIHGWQQYDLFTRLPDGSIRFGIYADKVRMGELMQPNHASIFESDTYKSRTDIDPRGLEPISLEPPSMTDEEERIAPLAAAVNSIRNTVAENPAQISGEGGWRHILTEVADTLRAAGDF